MRLRNTEIKINNNGFRQSAKAIVLTGIDVKNRISLNEYIAPVIKKGTNTVFRGIQFKKTIKAGDVTEIKINGPKIKYVIFSVAQQKNGTINEKTIGKIVDNLMKMAVKKRIDSIAFPVIGFGGGDGLLNHFYQKLIQQILNRIEDSFFLKKIVFAVDSKKYLKKLNEFIADCIGYIERKKGVYPVPTVDVIVELNGSIVLIKRKNPPFGWAIPGGFVEYGESLEDAATREIREETGLKVKNLTQFHTYSAFGRDHRFHTISSVFIAQGIGKPEAKSDAQEIKLFNRSNVPKKCAFDHRKIIADYFNFIKNRAL